MNASEAALAEQCRRGDREAFDELVRITARSIFARFYLETRDAHAAEDLTQETYLLAWRNVRSLAEARTFRAWLDAIAHSVLVDFVRHKGRKKRMAPATGNGQATDDAEPDPAAPSPPDGAEHEEQRQRMLAALRSMPKEYRQVLTLRYLIGADYQTISRELALTNGSLRGLLNRGMKLLRERMNERIS